MCALPDCYQNVVIGFSDTLRIFRISAAWTLSLIELTLPELEDSCSGSTQEIALTGLFLQDDVRLITAENWRVDIWWTHRQTIFTVARRLVKYQIMDVMWERCQWTAFHWSNSQKKTLCKWLRTIQAKFCATLSASLNFVHMLRITGRFLLFKNDVYYHFPTQNKLSLSMHLFFAQYFRTIALKYVLNRECRKNVSSIIFSVFSDQ